MNKFFVYILKSDKTNRFYIGYTCNIESRVKRHNGKRVISTRHGVPWRLVYFETLKTERDAIFRERQIKSYKSGKAFKRLIYRGVA